MTTQYISYYKIDSRTSPSIVWFTIKQSKIDPFHKGVKLCLGITDSVVCPVKALLPYLAIRGSAPDLLFLSEGKGPLTRAQFKTLVSAMLRKAGVDDSKYRCAGTVHNFLSYGLEGKAIAFPWHAGILVAFQNIKISKHSLPPNLCSTTCSVHYVIYR